MVLKSLIEDGQLALPDGRRQRLVPTGVQFDDTGGSLSEAKEGRNSFLVKVWFHISKATALEHLGTKTQCATLELCGYCTNSERSVEADLDRDL